MHVCVLYVCKCEFIVTCLQSFSISKKPDEIAAWRQELYISRI
jgi:hypothetical protein